MKYNQLNSLRQPLRRPVLLILSYGVVAALFLALTLLGAFASEQAIWNWLKVLPLPAVIALVTILGGAWFTRERARDTALQAYLNKMSELLIDKRIHREHARYADTRVTARARTLAVLSQLDGKRKRTVLLFLREARLINRQRRVLEVRMIYPRIVGLRNADLSNARLEGIPLISTDRKEAVSLEGANLRGADLSSADMERVDLRGSDLRDADLRGANLRDADLGVSEETQELADLSDADLEGANLKGAIITQEQLDGCKSLEGAIMSDGSKHN